MIALTLLIKAVLGGCLGHGNTISWFLPDDCAPTLLPFDYLIFLSLWPFSLFAHGRIRSISPVHWSFIVS